MRYIINELDVDDAVHRLTAGARGQHRVAMGNVIRKACAALDEKQASHFWTPGGRRIPKTPRRQAIDRACYELVLEILADWPGQPLGPTIFDVEERICSFLWEGAAGRGPSLDGEALMAKLELSFRASLPTSCGTHRSGATSSALHRRSLRRCALL